MARLFKLKCNKSYATEENAIKAVEKENIGDQHYYFIYKNEQGRFFPVFVNERAIQAMIHFKFNVVC